MYKTGLIEILSRLTSKQMKELSEFVKSPFFNRNESVVKLFEFLGLNHPVFIPEKIEKEPAYRKLFSKGEYSDSFMRMLIFKLTELTEKYLIYTKSKEDQVKENLMLADSLLELGLDKNAGRIINQTEKIAERTDIKDGNYFLNRYELEKLKHIVYSRSYMATTVKDKPDESLLEESNNLTAFYLINILKSYRYLLNKSYTVNSEYRLDFLPEIMEFLENEGKKYLKNITLKLLHMQIKLLLDSSDEKLFTELKAALTDDRLKLEKFDRRDGLTILSNLCIEKAYSGSEEFYSILLEIEKYLVKKNLYNRVKGGYFDKEVFTNIVAIALREGEISWAEEFIESNYKKLPPEIMENERNYCYSKLFIKTGDFEKAKEYISEVEYTDIHIKVNARITKIIVEYELGNIEEVINEIENFRKFIQNDKLLSKSNRKISSNFVKFSGKLCRARFSYKVNINELKNEITGCEMVNNRKWLIEKADELMQRKNQFI